MQNQSPRLVCLGFGYVARHLASALRGQGWWIAGTTRAPEEKAMTGVALATPDDDCVGEWLREATHLLISTPPGEGDDHARALVQSHDLPSLVWAGYLSSTGVYGDHQGAWVDESTPAAPHDARTQARYACEQAWRASSLPMHVFRLAGIYGPQRNALASVKDGTARCIVKPDHVFSRIHVADIVNVLRASMQSPRPGAIYNLADDCPSAAHEVTAFACALLGCEPPAPEPFEQAELSPMMRSFYACNRRVSNAKIKAELGIKLAYPSYKQGLTALMNDEATT